MKNKKGIAALIGVAVVATLAFGTASVALATPADGTEPAGIGLRLGGAIHDAGARLIDVLADLTGLSVDEVQTLRQDGSSVADIAESQDVSTESVLDEVLAARSALLDERVADGTIDEARAETMLENMTDRIEERITSTETGPFGEGVRAGGHGQGMGQGAGIGDGVRDGSCATD